MALIAVSYNTARLDCVQRGGYSSSRGKTMKELLLNVQLVYYIYVRKSTDVEDKQVLSVEAQIVELRKYAADNNMKIAGVIIEKQSAKRLDEKSSMP